MRGNTYDAEIAMLAISSAPPVKHMVSDKDYEGNLLRFWLIEHRARSLSKSHRKVLIEHNRQLTAITTSLSIHAALKTDGASQPASAATSRHSSLSSHGSQNFEFRSRAAA